MTLGSSNFESFERPRTDSPVSSSLNFVDIMRDQAASTGTIRADVDRLIRASEAPVQLAQLGDENAGAAIARAAARASDISTRAVLCTWGRRGSNPFYNPSMGLVGLAVPDMTPDALANILVSWANRLAPVERALAGDNRQTTPLTVTRDGREVPAAFRCDGQTVRMRIGNQNMDVPMTFPAANPTDYVVLFRVPAANSQWQLVAVNPRTNSVYRWGDVQYNADPTRLMGGIFGNGFRGLMGGWEWQQIR